MPEAYLYFDSYAVQWVLILAAMLVSAIASWRVRATYARYSRVPARSGMTGAQVAQKILHSNGIFDVSVDLSSGGTLSDHFDPKARTIRLSKPIYNGTSIAALSVAAHECGHAIQYQEDYTPIRIRNTILPVAQIGSAMAFPLVLIGILMSSLAAFSEVLIDVGIILFFAVLLFQLVTLPVEYNASSRGLLALTQENVLAQEETGGAKAVLHAAAGTYVASLLASLLTLLRLLALTNRRR